MNLQELMQCAKVWRAREMLPANGISTGFQILDDKLPCGGWPRAGLTEILPATSGIGALRLLLPAFARLSRSGQWIIWISPPHTPYSPALDKNGVNLARVLIIDLPEEEDSTEEQTLWAYEQALRFPNCGAALLWRRAVSDRRLRRLQIASEAGRTWGIVFRPRRFSAQTSPVPLRLELDACQATESADSGHALNVKILKARGENHGAQCRINL